MKNITFILIFSGLSVLSCTKGSVTEVTEYKCDPTVRMNHPRLEDHFADQGQQFLSITTGPMDECKACLTCRTGRVFILD